MDTTTPTPTAAEVRRAVLGCTDRCEDFEIHEHFTSPGAFAWMRLRIDRFHPADKALRIGLNRYPHHIVGAYVAIGGHGLGVRWKGTPARSFRGGV